MKTFRLLFEKQGYNYLLLFILLIIVFFLTKWQGVYDGGLWGLSTVFWFWSSIAIAIIHQLYVWFVWRMQLHLQLISRWFGKNAFFIYSIFFIILLIARVLFVFILGYANRNTWSINAILGYVLTVIILVPAIYTFYSVKKYFTLKRALGIDHFDSKYRELGMVRGGIYKYTSNAMYIYGAMVIFIPALVFRSKAALLSAFFNYAYLWVHYYTLELPDMKRIYFNR